MGGATVRQGRDTWAGAGAPARTHGDDRFLSLEADEANAYIFLKSPAPRGATILSATLRVRARFASSGSRTITARRVAASWKASKLNWNNKPGVVGATATDTIGTIADGDVIEFDVSTHLQSVADGSPHYGWRITTNAGTRHKIYGLNAGAHKPTLTVSWAIPPEAPTGLEPAGGAVSTGKPVMSFDYLDVSGATSLSALQVQIDAGNNFVSGIDFDSGEVATSVPELDLNDTAYAGLSDGATTYWRARVKDAAGLWSDWSDVVSFSRDNQGTLAITTTVVTEPTPEVEWSLTGETQEAFQVRVTPASDRTVVLYDSGKITSAEDSHGIPAGVITDEAETYSLQLRTWDAKDRIGVPGFPTFAEDWQDFTFDDDAGTTVPSTLTVTQVGTTPEVVLSWTRATAPDTFVLIRDGKIIEALIDPDEAFVSGTTYSWTDYTASPETEHTYTVRAVVSGLASGPSNTGTITPHVVGIWLVDPDRGLAVVLLDQDGGTWAQPDEAASHTPLGSSKTIRITSALRGLEGSLGGLLADAAGFPDREDNLADLNSIKEQPDQVVRLVIGALNIPVVLGDISIHPVPLGSANDPIDRVDFLFWQVGELPFRAVL